MHSGTPEVPEIFNLPEDPFPHLRVRGTLSAAADFITQCYSEDPPRLKGEHVLNIWLRLPPKLEEPEKNSLMSFFREIRERHRGLTSEEALQQYRYYWGLISLLATDHYLQGRYGFGTELPDLNSSDEERFVSLRNFMESHPIDSEVFRVLFEEGSVDITNNNYEALLEKVSQRVKSDLGGVSETGMDPEEMNVGLNFAHADALQLLSMIQRAIA